MWVEQYLVQGKFPKGIQPVLDTLKQHRLYCQQNLVILKVTLRTLLVLHLDPVVSNLDVSQIPSLIVDANG